MAQQVSRFQRKVNPLTLQSNATMSRSPQEVLTQCRLNVFHDPWFYDGVQAVASVIAVHAQEIERSRVAPDAVARLDHNGSGTAIARDSQCRTKARRPSPQYRNGR
jgi:hypothetical protein